MGFEEKSKVLFPATPNSVSRHTRSNSFSGKMMKKEAVVVNGVHVQPKPLLPTAKPDNIIMGDTNKSFNNPRPKQSSTTTETHTSLKQEILRLEKRLQDQFEERHTLEKALGYQASNSNQTDDDNKTPKLPATQLIKEIASLETEVVYLEQYLLSLYRKAFISSAVLSPSSNSNSNSNDSDQLDKSPKLHTPPPSRAITTPMMNTAASQSGRRALTVVAEDDGDEVIMSKENRTVDASVQRCHSSLSQSSSAAAFASSRRLCPSTDDSLGKSVRACQSQPLSMMEYAQKATTSVISLAEYLGAGAASDDHVRVETPNRLSEEMVKCMAVIYCKLCDPPLTLHHHHHQNGLSSPNSSFSSFSPSDMWSPPGFDNPFHVEGLEEFSGPYTTMLEVAWIHRDGKKLRDVEHLLQNYRSLICRLEEVDPRTLSHEEKLAFWINIHNALIMHAFLAYGIPQNSVKRVILLLKAAYNIGGHTISADTIQTTILGCRMSRPGQWLRVLFSPRKKFKSGDSRQGYAVHHPEPLLHFALCLGSHSDPAVRMYTPKRLMEELESAKEEYIRANYSVRKDKKISLPKIVDTYAKDTGLCHSIQQLLPPTHSLGNNNKCLLAKNVVWIPHNFNFRYLISKDLLIK